MVSKNVIEIVIKAIDNANKTINDVNKNISNMGNTGKNSNDKITDSTSKLHTAMNKLNGIANTVKGGFSSLGNIGKNALSSIQNALKSTVAGISNLGQKFSSLTSSFSTVGESIKQKWTSTTEYLKSAWDSASSTMSSIGQSISDSLNGAGASISGVFKNIRDEASSVSMSMSGIGEGIRESLNGASASISGTFDSIRNEATSVASSVAGAFKGIGSEISSSFSGLTSTLSSAKNGILGMAEGMSDLGNLIASSIGVTGVGSVQQLTVGLALSREKMTTLMRATMGNADAADALISKWDSMTDSSVVSLDMMIGAFNKVKMSSGQTAEKLSELSNSTKEINGHSTNLSSTLIRLGEAAILMGDDAGHAQFVMADAMDGLNGNFRTLQMNLGITKDKLLDQGWSGASDDVEGYVAALNGCLDQMGDLGSVMDTNAGAIEKLQKAFRVAGRKIGEIITPIIGSLIDTFNWLDQVLDLGATKDDGTHKSLHRLYTATILLFGGLSIIATVLPLLMIGLKLYNGAVASGVISTKLMTAVLGEQVVAEGAMIGITDLLSLSFWQAVFAEYAFLAPLIVITAAIIGLIAVMKYLYDNNETVRHSINVLGYYLNNIFVKAWAQLQKILEPLRATLQNLWNTFKYLMEVITGTNEATDGAGRGFDWLEAIIYSVGHVFLRLVETIVAVVEVIVGILVPIISLVINIFAELIKFVIKVAQAFSLLMQGDIVGFFTTLKDAIWNLVSNILTYIGQALLEIYHNLWSILGNVLTAIIEWLSSLPGIIWNFLMNIPNMLYNLGSALLYALGFALGLLWRFITEWFPQLQGMVFEAIIMLITFLIEQGVPMVISFGQQLYLAIQTAFWNMIEGARQILPQLPQILWNELLNLAQMIWNAGAFILEAIWGLCTSLINGFLDAMGIHSPGKLANAIKTEMVNLAQFIVNAIPTVIQKIISLAKQLINKFKDGIKKLPSIMWDELNRLKDRIGQGVGMVVDAIKNLAKSMVDKFKATLGIHSPGLISRLTGQEMEYTDEALTSATSNLEKSAESVGNSILTGFNKNDFSTLSTTITPNVSSNPLAVQTNIDPVVSQDSSDTVMNENTLLATTIQENGLIIDSSLQSTMNNLSNLSLVSTDSTNIIDQNNLRILTSYTNMVNNVNTMLNSVITNNVNGWNTVKISTESNLNSILSSTKNVTTQMIQAWNTMKNSIVKAAENIKSESTTRFKNLWSTIKTFYHNIQHPGGAGTPTSQTSRGTGFSSVGSALRTGLSSIVKPRKKLLSSIDLSGVVPTNTMEYMIPNRSRQLIATSDVLRYLQGYENKGAGWDSAVKPNTKYIKDKSNLWSVAGPTILGKYPTGLNIFKVKDFENGTPTIGYETFRKMAEAVFSQCHYEYYFNSEKYGTWQNAARGGGMNCSDSSDFLIALARACGLPAEKVHGHWNNIGHFWANIAGHKMDTTGWMLHRNWTPSQSHAGPSPDPTPTSSDGVLEHKGTVKLEIRHIIEGNVPQGITKEELVDLLSEKITDREVLKALTGSVDFQELDRRFKDKIQGARARYH